jgi:hypothetical protein
VDGNTDGELDARTGLASAAGPSGSGVVATAEEEEEEELPERASEVCYLKEYGV